MHHVIRAWLPRGSRGRRHSAFAGALALAVVAVGCHGGGKTAPTSGSEASTARLRIASAGFFLPSPVQREVAAFANDQIYLVGGLDSTQHSSSGVYAMNPATQATIQVGSVPQAFHDAAGATIGGKIFVFGGGTGESSNVIQVFDPVSRRGSIAGHLPKALSDASAATLGRTVYLVGGFDGITPQAAIYSTTDGLRFTLAGTLPRGLRYAAVAGAAGRIVIAGGVGTNGPVSTVFAFDPRTRKVSLIGRLSASVGHSSAFALGARVFVAGGLETSGRAARLVWSIDPATRAVASQPPLANPVSDAAAVSNGESAWMIGGWRGTAVSQVLVATTRGVEAGPSPAAAAAAGPAPSKVRPFAGLLLIADRGNNRLLVVTAKKRIVWQYPSPSLPPPPFRFYFPDDAFWVHGGHAILVSMEENHTIAEIAYPSGVMVWSYGHPGIAGSGKGYLYQPDDAYPYRGGVVVADAKNCRILFIDADGHASSQIGTNGRCLRGLPTSVGYPNGDTPLKNGDILISELRGGGFVDRVKPNGTPVWQVRVPNVSLPSDPQPLPDGTFLTVDYNTPGSIVRFTWGGAVVWRYGPTSGHGELSNPSLAVLLPNGLVAVNDDFVHRVLIIDPATNRIVWEYGVRGKPGKAPGYLNVPDGLDLIFPNGVIPLHLDFPTDEVTVGRP